MQRTCQSCYNLQLCAQHVLVTATLVLDVMTNQRRPNDAHGPTLAAPAHPKEDKRRCKLLAGRADAAPETPLTLPQLAAKHADGKPLLPQNPEPPAGLLLARSPQPNLFLSLSSTSDTLSLSFSHYLLRNTVGHSPPTDSADFSPLSTGVSVFYLFFLSSTPHCLSRPVAFVFPIGQREPEPPKPQPFSLRRSLAHEEPSLFSNNRRTVSLSFQFHS